MSKKLHFVGIGGSGVSGVATLAEKFGYEVTGCDLEENTAYGKNIFKGHDPSHIKDVDLVIASPALFYSEKENSEISEAKKLGKLMTWQEFLGKILLKDKKLICIAGTHGKSTTTAMAGKLLIDNGFDPIVVVGANVPEWGGNSRFGRGEYAIVEADEFNNNFLNYHPDIIVINNIEFDHPDFFKNEEEVKESFKKFIGNLKKDGILITSEDSPQKHFNLKVFGEHNQKNANMVFLLGNKLGIKDEDIIKSIESFSGIGRRMELIADRGGMKIYDDYAHHPTAIKTTLEGLREKYSEAKILAIDEPHGYKRTKALLSEYKGVFDSVDEVIIGPIFQARDEVDSSITPQKISDASDHVNIIAVNSFEELIENCKLKIGNCDVVVIMGAGKSYIWAREIANLIPISFSDLTTFRVGGKINKFFEVKNKEEIEKAIKFARQNKLPIFILGGGSDILASDKEFNGVVIKYIGNSISFNDEVVVAEGGANWDKLVEESVERELWGVECLSGIPGTVGASPIQNIGAYGHELSETFISLEAYDIENEKFVNFSKEDCQFGYRESIFKQKDHWQKYIICNVTFKLSKNKSEKVDYESLQKYITSENPTLSEIREAVLTARRERLENPKEVGNAGSFFMNPIIDSDKKEKLESEYPDIKIYPFGEKFKVSAGWLIEKSGWKGGEHGGAGVSPKHALILINKSGKATARDIYNLSEKIIVDVYKKFGIRLEREVQLINFKTAILGYGIEGQDAEKFFKSQKIEVEILDKKFDENYLKGLSNFDIIVRSPGVYRFLPEMIAAEKSGSIITSAVKIFLENCPGKVIGVTGTKGKGTTSTLIYEILKLAGKKVYLAGNIGKPMLELLPILDSESYVILEMSSFQLIDLDLSPHVAVVLNITLDHMDWHKNREEYVNAKKNIVSHQTEKDFAIINFDYETPQSFAKLSKAKILPFTRESLDPKFKEKLLLRGEHNWENIAAAVNAARALKIDEDKILTAVRNFKGLEHRLELVGEVDGITFYNDSFATGPQPTIAAINSFTEPETLILGGSDKGLDYTELREEIEDKENVKNLILIGDMGEKIGEGIKDKNIVNLGHTSMIRIIEVAKKVTPKGGVVILSPAAASFDMFMNYKDRGNQFKNAVENLKNGQ